MDHDRRYVLLALTLVIAAISAYFLRQILPTVFFAITVAYLIAPVQEFYERHGLSSWWASTATTVSAVGALVVLISPLIGLLYFRSGDFLRFIEGIPTEITIDQYGYTTTITIEEIQPVIQDVAESAVLSAARAAPTLAIKATVFAIVVFALLLGRKSAHDAVRAVVPMKYRDIVAALADRARDTLFAIYVLQAATAAVTFAISLPLFFGLGYDFWFSLSVISGLLQFVPIVGPSVLILAMAGSDVITQQPDRAAAVAVLGLVFVAYLPDPVIRPRLARRTADLPGSLYFIGFTGGLFTIGIVGVIAGPLLVALLVECVELLGDEMDDHRGDDSAEAGSPPANADDADAVDEDREEPPPDVPGEAAADTDGEDGSEDAAGDDAGLE